MNTAMIIIAGATATGKTAAAVEAAKKLGGEIISADSMQIYKYMDIGTAKPTTDEMRGIPHYLIGELYPDEEYNAAVFCKMAGEYLQKISQSGRIPIIAGGTGFYINALIRHTDFNQTAVNNDIRRHYETVASERGKEYLYNLLMQKDPLSAEAIHPNNVKRVIRALEYFETTGESIAVHNRSEKSKLIDSNIRFYVLDMNRAELYNKINARVDKMIDGGLYNEVEGLLKMGYGEKLVSMQGIGYKEMIKHIRGEYGFDEAVDKIKQASRNYAKRQVTWFKNQCGGTVLDASAGAEDISAVIENEMKRRQDIVRKAD